MASLKVAALSSKKEVQAESAPFPVQPGDRLFIKIRADIEKYRVGWVGEFATNPDDELVIPINAPLILALNDRRPSPGEDITYPTPKGGPFTITFIKLERGNSRVND